MTALSWDTGFKSGIDRCVLYPKSGPAEAWVGIVSISEESTLLQQTSVYQDGLTRFKSSPSSELSLDISAYTYPMILDSNIPFGFSYREFEYNGVGEVIGYAINVVYNAFFAPNQKPNTSLFDADLDPFSWRVSTTPEKLELNLKTSRLVVRSSNAYPWALKEIENLLYGTNNTNAQLPSAEQLVLLFENASIVKVTDHGDGSFTIEGPDEYVYPLDGSSFEVAWPSANYISEDTYRVESL